MLLGKSVKIKNTVSVTAGASGSSNLKSWCLSVRITIIMKNYLWKYFLPGLVLIGCAFWVGTLPQMILALAGFLSFFLAGVVLIIEGYKKRKMDNG